MAGITVDKDKISFEFLTGGIVLIIAGVVLAAFYTGISIAVIVMVVLGYFSIRIGLFSRRDA